MKIISFGHKKGVGKNECAKFLTIAFKRNCPEAKIINISFAEKLKDICHQLFSWAGLKEGIYYETHRDEKEHFLPGTINGLKYVAYTPRGIWINVGNAIRSVYQNTWIKYALQSRDCDFVIISDLRFKNEAQAIRDEGGILIKINRPDIEQGTDPAEVDLDDWSDWDWIIDNSGSLGDLNWTMTEIAEKLCQKN